LVRTTTGFFVCRLVMCTSPVAGSTESTVPAIVSKAPETNSSAFRCVPSSFLSPSARTVSPGCRSANELGFASTNFLPRNAAGGIASIKAGVNNGELWEWHTGAGWKIVPGSATSGANGIEISKDGKWFYMGGWGNQTFIRFSRGQTPVKRDEVPVGFRLDNLRWAPDGMLLAAGQEVPAQGIATSRVSKIDPNTLKVREVVRYPYNDVFSLSTGAIQVGKEIWVGSVRGDKIARFPAP